MYDYYIEQLKTDSNRARTAWGTIKTQLAEVYVLEHIPRAHKSRITRSLNNGEDWFKRVKSLMDRLPKDDKQPSSAVLTELKNEIGVKYLNTFSGLSCTVSTLPTGKDRKESIMIVVRSIGDYRANLQGTLQSLVDYMEETLQSPVD